MHGKRVSIIHTEIVKDGSFIYQGRGLQSPEDAAEMARQFVEGSPTEKLYVACLDNKGEPVSLELVSVGTSDYALVGMKEVYRSAVMSNSTRIIAFHNHTSGLVKPSREDIAVTERMRKAGEILGVELQDHIIIGDSTSFYSFCGAGLLKGGSCYAMVR